MIKIWLVCARQIDESKPKLGKLSFFQDNLGTFPTWGRGGLADFPAVFLDAIYTQLTNTKGWK